MATINNNDIFKGTIEHSKEDIPKAKKFFLNPNVVVNEGDDVLLTGNYTTDGGTSDTTIFKGRIDDIDLHDVQKVKLVSKANEINNIKPVGNYGNYVELVLGLVANQDCPEITIPFSSGNFSIRTDADIDTGTWSNGPGDFYPDLAARPNVIETGIYDDTMIYGLGDHSLPGPEHYQIWRIDVIVHCITASGGWLYVYLLKDGEWIERHLAIGDGWVDKTFRFEREGFDETDINDMQIKFTSDANGTWIDEVEVVVNWESYDDLEKTITEVSDQVFRGEKTAKQIFNWAKLQELKTWYLDPDLNFYFNDGDIDSGVDITTSNVLKRIKGKKQIKHFDKVVLLGGYVDGVQITWTSGVGDVIYTDTFANIIDKDTLEDLADQILSNVGNYPLTVQMFMSNSTKGFIQPGEEVSIEAGINYSNSDNTISAGQYKIDKIKYYMVNGVYKEIDLTLSDGMVFIKKESETPQDEETQTLISQNAQAIQEVKVEVAAGSPDHNNLNGLNDGDNYEHITQGQKDALHVVYTNAQAVQAVEDTGLVLSATKTITTGNEDTIHTFGRNQLGSGVEAGYAVFGYRGMGGNDYTVRANAAHTETRINVGAGAASKIRMGVNEANSIVIGVNGVTFGSGDEVNTFDNGTVATNSAIRVPTQQAVKTYHDANVGDSKEVSHAYVEATALIMENDITFNAGQTFDGKDVSGLCTEAEAHAYVEANALTLTADVTFNAGQLFDGKDVSAISITNQPTAINNWKVLYTDGAGDVQELALGGDGEVLTSTGVNSAPAFEGGGGGAFTPPIGYISMFSGAWTDNVTIVGWYKCDGNNGTVNLVNKFVRGAATSGGSGGDDDAVVVSHSHNFKINGASPSEFGTLNVSDAVRLHEHFSTTGAGVSGVGKNIPAYYALIFIQRIS